VAVFALAGCSALGDPGPPAGETAAERFTSLDGYSGTIEISYTGATTAENRTAHITVRPTTGESRIEVLEPAHRAGNVRVYNRTRVVTYNATEGSVTRTDLRGTNRTAVVHERLEQFFDRLSGDGEGRVGISPLPVVPGADPGEAATNATRLEYRYAGTETVLGRQTHVVEMRAVDDTDRGVVNQTVWVDAEWFVTLRAHSIRQFDDRRVAYTMRFTDIDFTADVPEGTFTFDPPANVTESTTRTRTTYDSQERLAAATDVAVPGPDVPAGFTLERTHLTVGTDRTQVDLFYRRGTTLLVVEKAVGNHTGLPDGERVAVGGRTGRYTEYGPGARVTWTCGEGRYAVQGGLGEASLVGVAETMVCE
jgi:outer membrane lipoprotein-sorting protein